MAKADIAGGFTGVRSALGDVERGKSLLAGPWFGCEFHARSWCDSRRGVV